MDDPQALAYNSLLSMGIFSCIGFAFFSAINDYSNAIAGPVASGFISKKTAKMGAIVFEIVGALAGAGLVKERLEHGTLYPLDIVPVEGNDFSIPVLPVCLLVSSMIAASLWMTAATTMGWSISATQTYVFCFLVTMNIAGNEGDTDWGMFAGYLGVWILAHFIAYFGSSMGVRAHKSIFTSIPNNDRFCRYLPYFIGFSLFPSAFSVLYVPMNSYWSSLMAEEWSRLVSQGGITALVVTLSGLLGVAGRKLLFLENVPCTIDEPDNEDGDAELLSDEYDLNKPRKSQAEKAQISDETALKEKELRWSHNNNDDLESESGSVAISTVGLTQNVDDIAVDTISWDEKSASDDDSLKEASDSKEKTENRITSEVVYHGLHYISMISTLVIHGLSMSALLSVPLSWFIAFYRATNTGVFDMGSSSMIASIVISASLGLGIYMENTGILSDITSIIPRSHVSAWIGQSVSNSTVMFILLFSGQFLRSTPLSTTQPMLLALLAARSFEHNEKAEYSKQLKVFLKRHVATIPACIVLSIICWNILAHSFDGVFTEAKTTILNT